MELEMYLHQSQSNIRNKQSGIALIVVIVFVMLSALLALWAARSSFFNELVVGNDADYQRALEAAQVLLQDAELDIRGEQSNGLLPCAVPSGAPAGTEICRPITATVWYPTEDKEVSGLLQTLAGTPTGCFHGICVKRTGNQDFWNDPTTLAAMMNPDVGARYGQYTGAYTGAQSNPILSKNTSATPNKEGGWYWVEVMPYDQNAGNSMLISNGSKNLALNLFPNVAYRITAIAHGLKANAAGDPVTRVVLQSTYVRQKVKN